MATTITTGVLTQLRYLPALVPDGTTIASLAAGGAATPAFQYGGITKRLVSLRGLQHSATAGVNLSVQADGYNSKGIDSAASALWSASNPLADHVWDDGAWNRLQVNAQNVTTAAVTNYWLAANILVEQPSIAQKLKWNQPLTAEEQIIAANAKLLGSNPRGVLPRTFEWTKLNEYQNQIVDAIPASQTLSVGTTAVTFADESAGANEMLVLAGLATSPGGGTATDGLTIIINVDNTELSLQWPAFPLGSGHPVPFFLQAVKNIQIQAIASSAVTTSISALIWHVRLTDEIRVRLGQITSGPVFDKIAAGVL